MSQPLFLSGSFRSKHTLEPTSGDSGNEKDPTITYVEVHQAHQKNLSAQENLQQEKKKRIQLLLKKKET